MEITTSANLSPPGFKTFWQPCVGEFLFRQFQDSHHATTGHPIKTLSFVKGFQILLPMIHFYTLLSTKQDNNSARSLLGVRWESAWSALGVGWESAGSPLVVLLESDGSSLNGLSKRALPMSFSNKLSKYDLQMRYPNYYQVECVGSLFGFWWLSVGSLISPLSPSKSVL